MSDTLHIRNPLHDAGWDDLLPSSPGSSFFHTSFWAKVLAESYGFSPLYFAAENNGSLSVLLPVMETSSILGRLSGVSLPFTDKSEPIIGDGPVSWDAVLESVISFGKGRRWRHLLINGDDHFPGDVPYAGYYDHIIDLSSGEGKVAQSIKRGALSGIRKATREGVTVSLRTDPQTLAAFYRLHCRTRRRHGLPAQPFSFFEKIHAHVLRTGHGFIAQAHYRGAPVAGAVFFHFGRRALYKYAASDERFKTLGAGNLVLWEAIRWYCRLGFESLTLGRTELWNQGLRRFKASWGSREEIMRYYTFSFNRNSFIRSSRMVPRVVTVVGRKLPLNLLGAAGKFLYRYTA